MTTAGADGRAVLFDWDDTLCGAVPHRYETIARVLERLGERRTIVEVHDAWVRADDPVVDRMANGFWLRLQRELGLTGRDDAVEALIEAFAERERERRFEIYTDVHAALDHLDAAGWRVGVVSNNVEAPERIREVGLDGRFAAVVTPRDVGGRGKPDPVIFHAALSRLRVAPGNCLYVGDTYAVDAVGARAAGLRPLLIDRLGIGAPGDCDVLATLAELPRWLPTG